MLIRNEILIATMLGALTALALTGWWLMTRRPQRWTLWVERENNFWRDKGVISSAFSEKLKSWETGRPLRILVGLTAMIGLIGILLTLVVLGKAMSLEHRKLRLPYNPALQVKPANPPKPKPN